MEEKTIPKAVPKKVKGTVLFTVVCVMMVLIVFLMGTLALAATASRRATLNYQKEQTETIARTVLDSVAKAVNEDTTTNGIKSKVASGSCDMNVAIEGVNYPVTVRPANAGGRSVYDNVTDSWVTGQLYEVQTRVATAGGNSETVYSMYMVLGTATKESTTKTVKSPSNGAFVARGGLSGTMGTSGLTTGGTQINLSGTDSDETFFGAGSAVQEAPLYAKGTLHSATRVRVHFPDFGTDDQKMYMAVTNNLIIDHEYELVVKPDAGSWEVADVKDYTHIPCLYVANKLDLTANISDPTKVGDDTAPVNVYVGWIDAQRNFEVHGDVYCFNPDETTKIKTTGSTSTKLYEWAERTIKNSRGEEEVTKFGNFFSKGNIEFTVPAGSLYSVGGDLRSEKDITFFSNTGTGSVMDITGDLVGKNITIKSGTTVNCRNVYSDNLVVEAGATLNITSGEPAKTVSEFSDVNGHSEVYPVGFTQEEILNNIITVPQTESYEDEKTYPRTLTGLQTATKVPILDSDNELDIAAENNFFWGTQNKEVNVGGTWVQVNPWWGYWDGGVTSWVPVTDTAWIKSSTILRGSANENIFIDTSASGAAGPVVVVLDNFGTQNNHCIIVDDSGGDVYFYVKGTFSPSNCVMITKKMLAAILGHEPTTDEIKNFKQQDSYNIPSAMETFKFDDPNYYPNVYIYGEEGSRLNCSSNCLLMANIRAPYMDYNGGSKGIVFNSGNDLMYNEGGAKVRFNGQYIGIIGQLIANQISVNNEWGLMYLTNGSAGDGDDDDEEEEDDTEDITNKVFSTLYYNYY